jgi:tetratricopeptide (TPR) repeat protein
MCRLKYFILLLTLLLAPTGFSNYLYPISKETNYTPKYNTLAHKIILKEPDLVSKAQAFRRLDKLIENAKKVLKKRGNYRRWQAEEIFKTIYMDMIYEGYDYKSNDFLSWGLVNGILDCDNYSLIYYAVAQEIGFPIYIVNLPKHTTLLWDPDGVHDPYNKDSPANKGDFYWETTLGEIRSDDQYKKSHSISEQSIKDGVFLNKVNNENMFAVLHNYLATKFIESRNYNEALKQINISLALDSKFAEAYNNKGIIYSNLKDYTNAVTSYNKALRLHPNFTLAYINKGIALQKSGEYQGAIEMYTDALAIESDFKPLYMLRSKLYKRVGLFDQALEDIERYESIK